MVPYIFGSLWFILLVVSACGWVWCNRSLKCISQTADDRDKIRKIVFADYDPRFSLDEWHAAYQRRLALYKAVSFDDHLHALQWGRNPKALYPDELHWN